VVDNNLFTNLMAAENLRLAADAVERVRAESPRDHRRLVERTGLRADEVDTWRLAADKIYIPYDEQAGVHLQDDSFMDQKPWDFAGTPGDRYPLLLHFHPLVIYRHQVLKQADVVLAMALRSDQFPLDQKRRNFDYYDPITTGDSSLSACVQAMAAAQLGDGYGDIAVDYFREALFVDLLDTHGNTNDGVHVASAGGVWGTIVFGFAGLFDAGTALRFSPSLPAKWDSVTFRMQRHGSRLRVRIDAGGCTVEVLGGPPVPIGSSDRTTVVRVDVGESHHIPRVDL
jgi:alpha,alpha-trehalose phosphorylase